MKNDKRTLGVVASQLGALLLLKGLGFPVECQAAVPAQASPSQPAPRLAVAKVISPENLTTIPANPRPEDLFRAHIFQEPLVPVGPEPTAAENSALAAALAGYSKRSGPDDFSALTGFLREHPDSSWAAAVLTDLGLEYYNTAHYSLAIEAWSNAWSLAGKARDAKAVALVQRAFGELIRMDSRLGRMDELERLLSTTGNQPQPGQASQRVVDAREALWDMKNRPQIAFRCGPLALRSIRIALGLPGSSDAEIYKSASTQKGCSLQQVAELSRKIGLNYQMAFRDSGDFVVPCVVHWKVGHYAALVRKAGELYELQDPTFGNSTWATKAALEAETSGYFLIGPGPLPPGWRAVNEPEGAKIWGKGEPLASSNQNFAHNDPKVGGSCPAQGVGMATAQVHLMEVNLHLSDNPLGYTPPVGPKVKFVLDYNLRDVFQPANFNYGNLGPQWTSDWFTYITDNPSNLLADVNLYVGGGGQRTYIGFNTNTQSYAYQQYDQNLLTRIGPSSYQLLYGDGSKMIFGQSDGSVGTSRNIFLTQEIDPQGNTLTFTYNSNLCLVAVTDAIGQVTTLTYGLLSMDLTNGGTGQVDGFVPADPYKLTSVTDPFGRTATFNYGPQVVAINYSFDPMGVLIATPSYAWGLASNTDVIGITSQYGYEQIVTPFDEFLALVNNFVNSLTTPYGTTSFIGVDDAISLEGGDTRTMDIVYPDASRERIEYYQAYVFDTNLVQFQSDPALSVPTGMATDNNYLLERDTYYWDRNASAQALGDFSKARLYHFCHTESGSATSGCLESMKPPLEGRIWFDYAGQDGAPQIIGSNTLPLHIGRVLDDGSTQLYTFGYNPFGNVTNYVDPVGRTFTFIYDTNGIDLREVRQTRLGNNELLSRLTYNSQHRPLTFTDAAGQTTTYTYNARGQLLTSTDALNNTMTGTYDANGYLLSFDGPLPGTNDATAVTYDRFGRLRTITDVSGYTLLFDYDALDRLTQATFPDSTFSQYSYLNLDCVGYRDRAGRLTAFEYDSMGRLTKLMDPLGRTTLFEWCRCGSPKSVIDPMGRMTSWSNDVQGRRTAKRFADGSQVTYLYENTTSRRLEIVDEKQQTTVFAYNADDSIRSVFHGNAQTATPGVTYTYDPNYLRVTSMQDGIGRMTYSYIPITPSPVTGAGKLASVSGPLSDSLISFAYDALGRKVRETVDGDAATWEFDAAWRVRGTSNALGLFGYSYDGNSARPISINFPNGQTARRTYGDNLHDNVVLRITNTVSSTPLSQFGYSWDLSRGQIMAWSQQAGAQAPSVFTFAYDDANQLLSALVTNSGAFANSFGYRYDLAGNRLAEMIGGSTTTATYNSLNQLSTTDDPAAIARTNEWDAENRLTAVTVGAQRTELGYDGRSRLVSIRKLQNGSPVSLRYFVWGHNRVREERDASGTNITKRFYPQGVVLGAGTNAGVYYYTRDHLGSIRELTDSSGNVRARYAYDPFGRRTKLSGDLDADFGFAGMFWCPEASLSLTHFRAYDPQLGRWLSRDPLAAAELRQGPNLYAYVGNEPISRGDPAGLELTTFDAWCVRHPAICGALMRGFFGAGAGAGAGAGSGASDALNKAGDAVEECKDAVVDFFDSGESGESDAALSSSQSLPAGGNNTLPSLPPPAATPPSAVESPPGVASLHYDGFFQADTIIGKDPALSDTLISSDSLDLSNENDEWADRYLDAAWNDLRTFDASWTPEQWQQNARARLRAIDTFFLIRGRHPW